LNVIFYIPVPGWLPTTSTYGDKGADGVGTRYALYATATFVYLEDGNCSIFSSFCSPFRSRTRTINAQRHPTILTRFVEVPSAPSSASTSVFPMTLFIVDAQPGQDSIETDAKAIPPEILKKVEVIASIPDAVTMEETSIPFTLRLRGNELNDSQRERLRISDFTVDVEQIETFRCAACFLSTIRGANDFSIQEPYLSRVRSSIPGPTYGTAASICSPSECTFCAYPL